MAPNCPAPLSACSLSVKLNSSSPKFDWPSKAGHEMGGGSGNGTRSTSLRENLKRVQDKFGAIKNGYFGSAGSTSRVRTISTDQPRNSAIQFFKLASQGAKISHSREGSVTVARFLDGSAVSLRPSSRSDGSPAIQIKPSTSTGAVKAQKIHFVKEEL